MNLRLVFLAVVGGLSVLGDVSVLSGMLIILSREDRPVAVTLLLVAQALGAVTGGQLVTRALRRATPVNLIIVATATQAMLYALAAATPLALNAIALIPVVFIDSVLAIIAYACISSLVPNLATGSISAAFGKIQMANTMGRLSGPALGGILVSTHGSMRSTLVVNALSFAVVAIIISAIFRTISAQQVTAAPSKRSKWSDSIPVRPSWLRSIVLLLALSVVTVVLVDAAYVFYARTSLSQDDLGVAFLLACGPVGALASTALRIGDRTQRLILVLAGATVAMGFALAVDVIALTLVVSAAACALFGAGHAIQNRVLASLISNTVDENHGPMWFAFMGSVLTTASVIGYFAAAPLLVSVSSRSVLGVPIVACLIIGIALAYISRTTALSRRAEPAATSDDSKRKGVA